MNFGVIRQEIEKLPDKAGSARELIETIARELVRTVVKRAQVRQWILTFSRTTSHGKEMVQGDGDCTGDDDEALLVLDDEVSDDDLADAIAM